MPLLSNFFHKEIRISPIESGHKNIYPFFIEVLSTIKLLE